MKSADKSDQGIGFVIIATNGYLVLGLRLIKMLIHHYRGDARLNIYLFSDRSPQNYLHDMSNVHYIHAEHDDFVSATTSKFRSIAGLKEELVANNSHVYYVDADTAVKSVFTEQWFLGEIVVLRHFMNDNFMKNEKHFERSPESSAYIPFDTLLPQTYYHACFWGGETARVIEICEELCRLQEMDEAIGYMPVVHDESYLNHYFHYHPSRHLVVLPPGDFQFEASDKGGLETLRNPGLDISGYLSKISNNANRVFNFDSAGNIQFD